MTFLLSSMIGCLPATSNVLVSKISNSEYTATLSTRNSGAMSRGSTLVSIRLNTVPDDDSHGQIVLGVTWNKPVEMNWTGVHALSLSCTSCTQQDVNYEVVKAGDVVITYDANLRIPA